jgi:head-tail adaptor
MTVAGLLDSTLTIKRKARTSDGQGGHPITFAEIGSAFGRVSTLSARDLQLAGQKQGIVTHAIYAEPGADIVIGDRIETGGRTFEVRTPNQAGPTYPYQKVLCEEYQKGA